MSVRGSAAVAACGVILIDLYEFSGCCRGFCYHSAEAIGARQARPGRPHPGAYRELLHNAALCSLEGSGATPPCLQHDTFPKLCRKITASFLSFFARGGPSEGLLTRARPAGSVCYCHKKGVPQDGDFQVAIQVKTHKDAAECTSSQESSHLPRINIFTPLGCA